MASAGATAKLATSPAAAAAAALAQEDEGLDIVLRKLTQLYGVLSYVIVSGTGAAPALPPVSRRSFVVSSSVWPPGAFDCVVAPWPFSPLLVVARSLSFSSACCLVSCSVFCGLCPHGDGSSAAPATSCQVCR